MKRWIKNCLVTGGALLVGGMALSAAGAMLGETGRYDESWEEMFDAPFGFYNGFGLWHGSGFNRLETDVEEETMEVEREPATAAQLEQLDREVQSLRDQAEALGGEAQNRRGQSFPQEESLNQTFDLAPFEQLRLLNSCCDVIIRQGESWQLEVRDLKGEAFYLEERDGVLLVEYDVDGKLMNRPASEEMVLTIPRGKQLRFAQIDSGVGDTHLVGISAQELALDGGVGELELKNVDANALELNCGVGDIQGEGLKVTSSLKVTGGVGDVELEGEMTGELELASGVGNLSLELKNASYQDYRYDVQSTLGEVRIGEHNNDWGGSWKEDNEGADSLLTIRGGTGEVRVTFEQ